VRGTARETLGSELTGHHENANCHASPGGEATLRRPAPQRLARRRHGHGADSARRAPSKFARRGRAETRSQPSRCLKKRRQRGDGGTFGPASLRSSTRPHRPRSWRRSRVRRFRLIPRTSRQPLVVQEVRVAVAPRERKSRSNARFQRLRWRDPDSNRGHHDFQSCSPDARIRRIWRGLASSSPPRTCPGFLRFCVRSTDVTADDACRRPFRRDGLNPPCADARRALGQAVDRRRAASDHASNPSMPPSRSACSASVAGFCSAATSAARRRCKIATGHLWRPPASVTSMSRPERSPAPGSGRPARSCPRRGG
jgi:hypothetical protein